MENKSKVDIVDRAEKAIQNLKKDKYNKIGLNPTKIRKFLTAVTAVKNKVDVVAAGKGSTFTELPEELALEVKLLKTNIFPNEIAAKEIKYYLTKQNKYGLPLDNRETYTKTDWIMWTATLANDKATFEQFIKPVYLFMNKTTDRVPMSDWVFTDRPNQRGFQARSVVGGYFIKMLEDKLK